MSAPTCPVITDAQQAAIKPWAMLLIAWKTVQILALVIGIVYYVTVKPTESRWLWTLFFGMVLTDRLLLYYYAYRTGQIVGVPDREGQAYLPRSVIFSILFFVFMIVLIWW